MVFDALDLLPRRLSYGQPQPPSAAAVALARAALIGPADPPAPAPPRTPPRSEPAIQLTVSLRHVEPAIWRRLVVPASLTLRELHAVLQTAMGWEDCHLHVFEVAGVLYGDIEEMDGRLGNEETFTVARAAEAASTFRYEYDIGDGWEHDIRFDQTLPGVGVGTPHLTGGARACPPEDCGGPWGYSHLLEILADPSHPEHEVRVQWVGGEFDAAAFDLQGTNANLELHDRQTRRRRLPSG